MKLSRYRKRRSPAYGIYGVVVGADGKLDEAASSARRVELRQSRVARGGRQTTVLHGAVLCEASVNLHLRQTDDGAHWACAKCASDLGAVTANYKDGCLREDHPVADSNPLIGDPARFIDDDVSFRQFFCPGCGAQIDNEIAVSKDEILADIGVSLR